MSHYNNSINTYQTHRQGNNYLPSVSVTPDTLHTLTISLKDVCFSHFIGGKKVLKAITETQLLITVWNGTEGMLRSRF